MKKNSLVLVLGMFLCLTVCAQNFVNFQPRFDGDVKGDMAIIGNAILGPNNEAFNDKSEFNQNVFMRYIDVDEDDETFSSSSADLEMANTSHLNIVHAGLYWSAVNSGDAMITAVKLKGPNDSYQDVTGTVIFNANSTDPLVGNNGNSVDTGDSFPYVCYADVTELVNRLTSNLGTYTVANISSIEGRSFDIGNGSGYSAGWSLFIVYEDEALPQRAITSFDGFSAISAVANPLEEITVSGFRVAESGPVRANLAFAVLEGDSSIIGDQFGINGVAMQDQGRPFTNFFNSTISQEFGQPISKRNPNSTNTLGFDTGIISIPNPLNVVIENEATEAEVTFSTTSDTYFPYFLALSVNNEELTLDTTTENLSNSSILLSPNPTEGTVILNTAINVNNVVVYDYKGLKIKEIKGKAITKIDLSLFSNGVYFVSMTNEKGAISTKKIVKQ